MVTQTVIVPAHILASNQKGGAEEIGSSTCLFCHWPVTSRTATLLEAAVSGASNADSFSQYIVSKRTAFHDL